MKKITFLFYLLLIEFIRLIAQPAIHYEIPKSTFKDQQIITHSSKTISFSEEKKQAYWVAYQLIPSEGIKIKRTNKFIADPEITKANQASNSDYKKSGYDKGHLAPAADMNWSIKAMTESFYFSNMSPQKPQFNRGIWKKLEELVRKWAIKYGNVYIATGPILDSFIEYIGNGKIGAPSYFYKAVLFYSPPKPPKAIAFILKNEASSFSLSHFVVSINELEKRTQIDFFYQLPDDVENTVESNANFEKW